MKRPVLSPEEVRAIRERFGITQAEMETRLGVGKDAVRGWESGKRRTPGPASVALRLLDRLNSAKKDIRAAMFEGIWD